MVTRTAPRSRTPPHLCSPDIGTPVALTQEEKEIIAEGLGIDPKLQKDLFHRAIADIEALLTRAKSHLNAAGAIPLPAHINAELLQIVGAADGLLHVLRLDRMHPAVWRELTSNVDELAEARAMVLALRDTAFDACEKLSLRDHRGSALTAFKESKKQVEAALEQILDTHWVDSLNEADRAASLTEILKICRKYLPSPPNKRRQNR